MVIIVLVLMIYFDAMLKQEIKELLFSQHSSNELLDWKFLRKFSKKAAIPITIFHSKSLFLLKKTLKYFFGKLTT